MPYKMWVKLDEFYNMKHKKLDEDYFETTPQEFLENVGLPNGLSAYFNDDECVFFNQIYDLERKQRAIMGA